MSINTGGPAFPVTNDAVAGMTLRDYFAAKAMQGICSHPDTWGESVDGIARKAYALADAMLKAREGL
jgi:hypothetical protein